MLAYGWTEKGNFSKLKELTTVAAKESNVTTSFLLTVLVTELYPEMDKMTVFSLTRREMDKNGEFFHKIRKNCTPFWTLVRNQFINKSVSLYEQPVFMAPIPSG